VLLAAASTGLSIGIGMIPRGEVGLIFASIGLGLSVAGERIVDQGVFSAVVIMVIVTTMATPPALKWSLGRTSATQLQGVSGVGSSPSLACGKRPAWATGNGGHV
jgi:Kef-type K+ transport system membrane component KefB